MPLPFQKLTTSTVRTYKYVWLCLDQGPDISLRSLHLSPRIGPHSPPYGPTYPLRMNSQDHKVMSTWFRSVGKLASSRRQGYSRKGWIQTLAISAVYCVHAAFLIGRTPCSFSYLDYGNLVGLSWLLLLFTRFDDLRPARFSVAGGSTNGERKTSSCEALRGIKTRGILLETMS